MGMENSGPDGLVPAFVGVEVAGALCGLSRQQSYDWARSKELPTERVGQSRLVVPIAQLEKRIGRSITASDVQRAIVLVRARKQARRATHTTEVA